jgi:nucleoside-diphosphate-sugar epimerase
VLYADRPGGMRTAVVLPSLIWGPRMPTLEAIVKDASAGRFAWPNGAKQVMSTSHVDNVCHCTILAAERSPGARAYFVTDGEDHTFRKTVTDLLSTRGVEPKGLDVPIGLAWGLSALIEGRAPREMGRQFSRH